MDNLCQNLLNKDQNNKLQRYRSMVVKKVQAFSTNELRKGSTNKVRSDGIVLLDMSSQTQQTLFVYTIPLTLSYILPNLREIDFTSAYMWDNILE